MDHHYISEFLDYLSVEKGLAKNSIDSYRRDLEKYAAYLEKKKIRGYDSVTRDHIISYLMSLKKAPLAATSIARNLVAIKLLHRFLLRERFIKEDITSVLDAPRTWKKLPHFLTIQEVEKMLTDPSRNPRFYNASTAAVWLDVKTGEILAMASVPTFDLNLARTKYNDYRNDPNKPFLNRATHLTLKQRVELKVK